MLLIGCKWRVVWYYVTYNQSFWVHYEMSEDIMGLLDGILPFLLHFADIEKCAYKKTQVWKSLVSFYCLMFVWLEIRPITREEFGNVIKKRAKNCHSAGNVNKKLTVNHYLGFLKHYSWSFKTKSPVTINLSSFSHRREPTKRDGESHYPA